MNRQRLLRLRRFLSSGVVLFIALFAVCTTLGATGGSAVGALLWHLAVEDRAVFEKDPAKFSIVRRPPEVGGGEVFVERAPALKIPGEEIRAIVAGKMTVNSEVQRRVEEARKAKGEWTPPAEGISHDFRVTFVLHKRGMKKFREFAKEHDQQQVEVRFRGESLGVVTLHGPFEEDETEVSISGLSEKTLSRLKAVYPRLRMEW